MMLQRRFVHSKCMADVISAAAAAMLQRRLVHSSTTTTTTDIVTQLCNSLRKGYNWATLNQNFTSLQLNPSLIQQVLIQLKEPCDAKRALGFFHWSAKCKNICHGLSSYSITLHILVRARMFMDAQALLESIANQSSPNLAVAESLMSSYRILMSNPVVFDLLVQVYSKFRMFDTALDVCYYLEQQGFCLRIKTYNNLIRNVEKSDQNELIWKIYEHMIQMRTYPNGDTIKFMIGGLCKEGKLQILVDMIDRILGGKRASPMVIVNTTLIFRIIENGRVDDGVVLLKRMLQKGLILDTIGFSLIVYGRIKIGNLNAAWQVFEEMLKRGLQANSFVYTSFIEAYSKEEKTMDRAIQLMQDMEDVGLTPYDETFDHLIIGCANLGEIEDSLNLCKKMVEKGLVTGRVAFNEMARKLSSARDVKSANALLTLLLDNGFEADEMTYSYLIDGYRKSGEVEQGLKLLYEMKFIKSLKKAS